MGRNYILLWGLLEAGDRLEMDAQKFSSLSLRFTDWSPFPVHVIVILRTALLLSNPGKGLFSPTSLDQRRCGWSPAWRKCPPSPPPCTFRPDPSQRPVSASSSPPGRGSTGTHTDRQPGCPREWVLPSKPTTNSKTYTIIRRFVNQFQNCPPLLGRRKQVDTSEYDTSETVLEAKHTTQHTHTQLDTMLSANAFLHLVQLEVKCCKPLLHLLCWMKS